MNFEPVTIDPEAYKEEPWNLYDPQGNFVGVLDNYFSFLDVRVQIKNRQVDGFYIERNGCVALIQKDGQMNPYPHDLFPMMDRSLIFLIMD
jgi:hypothetical protein